MPKMWWSHFSNKIWMGPFEEPCLIKDPEMKKFHFCFSHLSKEAEGKKRLSLKFSGFSLVSMLEDQEPRSRFITKKAEWLWEREWESLKWTFSLQVLTVKILRLQGGNSIILNLGGKTKILSYVSCFYQKSLAKKKNKPFLRKCLLTILRYVSYCFFPRFQSFPQTRALLISHCHHNVF